MTTLRASCRDMLFLPVSGRPWLGNGSMERDSKRIAREWKREIEAEMRRLAARQDEGRWRIVVWAVLEGICWAGLVVVVGLITRLHWGRGGAGRAAAVADRP